MGALDGKVALVTGGSRSIGRGCAIELGAAGATVYLTGRSATEADNPLPGTVGATAAEVIEAGGDAVGLVCDHRDDDAVAAVFDRIESDHGRLDVLVNNAFIVTPDLTSGKPFWEVPLSDWDDMIDVGTRSAYVASAMAAKRFMVPAGSGTIVNISSSGATEYAWHVVYGVGKCALDRITRDTAHELGPHGVTVVSLWPGFVKNERIELAERAGMLPASLDTSTAESFRFTGRAAAHLAADPDVARWTGQALTSRDLADAYNFTDIDGSLPDGPLHDRGAD
ncbi:MAG: SDR family NAD(P)-dependent oxidoreductase [Acidimicrobiales bacterium]|nr:SDR family NAD(P)-dependent oxidoreductase [Acidimicrobiales bacterium]